MLCCFQQPEGAECHVRFYLPCSAGSVLRAFAVVGSALTISGWLLRSVAWMLMVFGAIVLLGIRSSRDATSTVVLLKLT